MVLFFCFFVLSPLTGRAQEAGGRHRVVVVLCDRLTWEDVNADCPFIVSLFGQGALGLMNTATAGPKNATSATLALALGQQQPSEPGDELAINTTETLPDELGTGAIAYRRRTGSEPAAGRTIAQLHIASLTQRHVSANSLGALLSEANPPRRVLICGNADTDVRQRRGALLAIDAAGTAVGDVALNRSEQSKPFGRIDDISTLARYATATDADVFVAVLGDLARVEAIRSHVTPAAYHAARQDALRRLDAFFLQLLAIRHLDTNIVDVLLISPCPPSVQTSQQTSSQTSSQTLAQASQQADAPETWERLTPVFALGPHFPPGLLTSPTTRTRGLIANIDIAPTLLGLLAVPIPPVMVGRPMRMLADADLETRQQAIARLDFVTTLNAQALTRVMMPIAALCFALAPANLFAFRHRRATAGRWLRPGLIYTLTLPLGCLLATLWIPPTLPEYGLRILAWMLGLTAGSFALARLLRISPPVACGLLGILLIVIDLCCGQPLIKDSVWSGYALSGIRYYGIGNEYLGVVLGYALLSGFGWLTDRDRGKEEKKRRRKEEKNSVGALLAAPKPGLLAAPNTQHPTPNTQHPTPNTQHLNTQHPTPNTQSKIVLCWFGVALVLGWPTLGANAGSLIVSAAGFGVGAWMLTGKRFVPSVAVACVLLGIVLSFVFGALDAAFLGANASHAGNVLNAAGQGRGAGYLAEIMVRKIGMNLRLLTSPFFLLGASLVATTVLLMRAIVGDAACALLLSRPRLRQSLPALAVTFFAALLFKDSGVVTAGILAGITCLYFLWHTLKSKEEG